MILHRSYKSFLTTQRNGAAAVAGPRLFFLLIVAVLFSGVQAQSTPPQSAPDAFSTSFEQSNYTNGSSTASSRAVSAIAATKDILVSEFPVSNTMTFFCGKFLCPLCTFT